MTEKAKWYRKGTIDTYGSIAKLLYDRSTRAFDNDNAKEGYLLKGLADEMEELYNHQKDAK